MSPEAKDFTKVSSWEDLAELATLELVCKVMQNRENSKARTREKGAKDRAILRYAKEHPEEFENIPQ